MASDMTWAEWKLVSDWMADLWPGRPWPEGSVLKVKDTLGPETSEDDVWNWLNSYADHTAKHPPQPAEVIAGVKGVTRRRLKEQAADYKVLPAGKVDGAAELEKYLAGVGVESFGEAVELEREKVKARRT